jgi:preprotein translocase subunit SecE
MSARKTFFPMTKDQIKYLAFVIGLVTAMLIMKYC